MASDTEESPNLRNIVKSSVAITTTGEDGAAVGSGVTSDLNGFLTEISIDYHASAPATTDVVITDTLTGATVFTRTDTKDDATFYPRVPVHDNVGAAISGAYDKIPLAGSLTISVAGCDALTDAVTVKLKWEHNFV